MISVIKLLDRYEILYPNNEKIPLLRRSVFEKDFGSIFKLLGEDYDDLRKAVMEKNMHSIFRLLGEDYTELRKAVVEQNIWSIFRLAEDGISPSEQWTERQIHLRKAICNDNPWSIFRLTDQEDLRKAVLLQDIWSVFRILDEWQPTQFTKALKGLMIDGQEYDLDCMSRGQLRSKKWLVEQLAKLDRDLGTVFLCCGWYATLATMLFESNIKLDKIRMFHGTLRNLLKSAGSQCKIQLQSGVFNFRQSHAIQFNSIRSVFVSLQAEVHLLPECRAAAEACKSN